MRKPRSKRKQKIQQKNAAKRNRRDIRIRAEKSIRRKRYERARELTAKKMNEFLVKVDEAQRKLNKEE